jgi:hypothetical protein
MSGGHRHHIGAAEKGSSKVQVLVTSNDPVRLSFLTALLADAGIGAVVLDAHTSAIEGSIGAIPRRLMVATEDEWRARHVLREAGEL